MNCFPNLMTARPVPRSTSSDGTHENVCQLHKTTRLTLKEQREESNHKYQKDTDDATMNPIKDGCKVVATSLACDKLASSIISTNGELRVKRPQEDH
jgi:hypothetical protein